MSAGVDKIVGGGNRRFETVGQALNAISEYLSNEFNVNPGIATGDQIPSADPGPMEMPMHQEGRTTMPIQFNAPADDPFSPGSEVDNAMLAMQWYRKENGYEVIAYIT